MLFFKAVLIFVLILSSLGYFCKSDQCATFKIENNTRIKFQIINRSLFGGTRIRISKLNDSTTYFDFFTYVKGTQIFYSVHPDLQKQTFNNTNILVDNLVIKQESLFQLPVSYHLSFQGFNIYFNSSQFLQVFNTEFNVKLQMSSHTQLSQPLYALPAINEEYSFTVNLTNFTKEIVLPVRILNKLSPIHPAWFTFNMAFYLTCIILIICFRNYQPIRSRGAIIYFNSIFQILMEFSTIYIFLPLETQQRNDVQISIFYFQACFEMATLTTQMFVVIGLFYRFLILMFLNQRKLLFHIQNEAVQMKWYWRFLKYTGEVWVTIVNTIPFYFFICGVFSLAVFLGDRQSNVRTVVVSIMASVLCIIGIIDFIAHMYQRRQNNFFHNLYLFWKEDTLYFKMEIYIFGLSFQFPTFILRTIFLLLDKQFLELLANTLLIYFVLIQGVVFVIIVTIVNFFRNKYLSYGDKAQGELTRLLNDPEGFALIRYFAKLEYSTENVTCYESIQKFKLIKTQEEIERFIQSFIILFLNGSSSELEINITKEICERVKEKVGKKEYSSTMLDEVEYAIKANLSDTFQRLRTSSEYSKYKKEKSLVLIS